MILREYTNKSSSIIPLGTILLCALILRLYKIHEIFPFDFDQQIPAFAARDFLINGKLSLIGQELSFQGLFIGPLHTWVQFIPYAVCNLKPDCVPYFFTIIGVLTIAAIYFIVRKIVDTKTARIIAILIAVSFAQINYEIIVNSNFFILPASAGLVYFAHLYYRGKNWASLAGSFIAGLATVNFNPIFIFSAVAYYSVFTIRRPKQLSIIPLNLLMFAVNFLPLIIFDVRHSHILLNSVAKFANQNVTVINPVSRFIFLVKDIELPFYSNFLFQSSNPILILFTLALILKGAISTLQFKKRFYLIFPLWILASTLGFVFYSGHIPDYYFLQTILPFVILITLPMRKSFFLFLIFIVIFLYTNISHIINYKSNINYLIKKKAVEYVVKNSNGATFNVYYDMPAGLNTGYGYLFTMAKQEPRENGQFLYILEFADPSKFIIQKYYKSFPDKHIQVETFNFLHVISVK